jgi:hypothetical protein
MLRYEFITGTTMKGKKKRTQKEGKQKEAGDIFTPFIVGKYS